LKQEQDNTRNEHENKIKQLLSEHSVRINELQTQFSLENTNLKNKHALSLESAQKDQTRENNAKISQYEMRELELKSKLENQQTLLKTD